MRKQSALVLVFALALVTAPVPALASPAAVATAVQETLLSGRAVAATLAVTVLGYFFLTGRSALQSMLPLAVGLFLLGSAEELIGLAQGDWVGFASWLQGWLRSLLYSVLVLALLFLGYSYWFGGGSYRQLYPVLWGIVIVLGASEFAGAAMG